MQHANQAHFSPAYSQPVIDFPYRQVEPGIGYPGPSVAAMTLQGGTIGAFLLQQAQKDALLWGSVGLVAGGGLGALLGQEVGFGDPVQSTVAGAALGGLIALSAVLAFPRTQVSQQ